jgi:hypothetical protein
MRFEPGLQFPVAGYTHFRFVQGDKAAKDVRMEIFIPQWTKVSMKLGFVLADFYAQNERVLYPYLGNKAGARYISFCRGAQSVGWEAAAEQLDLERAHAAQRRMREGAQL